MRDPQTEMWRALIAGRERAVHVLALKGCLVARLGRREATVEDREARQRMDALVDQVKRVTKDFEMEMRCANLGYHYEPISEEQRAQVFEADTEYREETHRARAEVDDDFATRRWAGDMGDWTANQRSAERARLHKEACEPHRKKYDERMREIGLIEKVWPEEKEPTFWTEFRARCKENTRRVRRSEEHPYVRSMEEFSREANAIWEQVRDRS